jgi:hypothetical protein
MLFNRGARKARNALTEELIEVAGRGSVMKLAPAEGKGRVRSDAIHQALFRFMQQPKPYAGLIIDLRGTKYSVSSADLATLMFAMMDHDEKRLLPCCVLLDDAQAQRFRQMLEVTELGFPELHILDSMDAAMEHSAEPTTGE